MSVTRSGCGGPDGIGTVVVVGLGGAGAVAAPGADVVGGLPSGVTAGTTGVSLVEVAGAGVRAAGVAADGVAAGAVADSDGVGITAVVAADGEAVEAVVAGGATDAACAVGAAAGRGETQNVVGLA